MRPILAIYAVLAVASVSTNALAQDRSGQDNTIIVEGEAPHPPEAVRDLVVRLADERGPQVAATRFFDALCLAVSGLNRAGNDYLRERIEDNARAAGLDVQRPGCRVNAQVLIHGDPAALVERIKEEAPAFLPREIRGRVDAQVARGERIIVWHNEEDRNEGGRRIGVHQNVAGGTRGVHDALNVEARINNNNWPSRGALSHSSGVVSAGIILDADIAAGMLIDRLADYATMRLLAPDLVPLTGDVPEPATITAPFPGDPGSPTLTRFDRAYLAALYSLRPNAPATQLAGAVAAEYEGRD